MAKFEHLTALWTVFFLVNCEFMFCRILTCLLIVFK